MREQVETSMQDVTPAAMNLLLCTLLIASIMRAATLRWSIASASLLGFVLLRLWPLRLNVSESLADIIFWLTASFLLIPMYFLVRHEFEKKWGPSSD